MLTSVALFAALQLVSAFNGGDTLASYPGQSWQQRFSNYATRFNKAYDTGSKDNGFTNGNHATAMALCSYSSFATQNSLDVSASTSTT